MLVVEQKKQTVQLAWTEIYRFNGNEKFVHNRKKIILNAINFKPVKIWEQILREATWQVNGFNTCISKMSCWSRSIYQWGCYDNNRSWTKYINSNRPGNPLGPREPTWPDGPGGPEPPVAPVPPVNPGRPAAPSGPMLPYNASNSHYLQFTCVHCGAGVGETDVNATLSLLSRVRQWINKADVSWLKGKFHHAIWFEAGRRQVRSRFAAGRWQASNLSATSFEPASNQLA